MEGLKSMQKELHERRWKSHEVGELETKLSEERGDTKVQLQTWKMEINRMGMLQTTMKMLELARLDA